MTAFFVVSTFESDSVNIFLHKNCEVCCDLTVRLVKIGGLVSIWDPYTL